MKQLIPATTSPATKLIRTGEGILIYVFGAILIAIPLITSNLPPALAASLSTSKYVVLVTLIARTALKIILAFAQRSGQAPIPFSPLGQVSNSASGGATWQYGTLPPADIGGQVELADAVANAIQSKPGKAPEEVKDGEGLAATADVDVPKTDPKSSSS